MTTTTPPSSACPQPEPPDGLHGELISAETVVGSSEENQRLGHLRFAPVTQLEDEPLVTLTRGSALRTHLETHAMRPASQRASPSRPATSICSATSVVRGLGVTIVPRSVAEAASARHPLRIIGIRPAITQRYTFLVWNEDRHHTTAVEAFSPTPGLGPPRRILSPPLLASPGDAVARA
jgi:DNA-binding transcriptional LysR family regulator